MIENLVWDAWQLVHSFLISLTQTEENSSSSSSAPIPSIRTDFYMHLFNFFFQIFVSNYEEWAFHVLYKYTTNKLEQ